MNRWLTCTLVVAALAATAQAQGVVRGEEAELRTAQVLERLDWKDSLAAARAEAAESGKMILWVQLVGELGGGL